jgi:hypothetical protein
MRHILKLYFEMTILLRKSYCYFDIAVIGSIQGDNEVALCFNPLWLH